MKDKDRIKTKETFGRPGSDQAYNCIPCLCGLWPEVWRTPGSRRYGTSARWTIRCVNCDKDWIVSASRADAIAEWNEQNKRLNII